VHRDQPAVVTGQHAYPRSDPGRPGGQQRERKLAEHTSHHPPIPQSRLPCKNFLTYRAQKTGATRQKSQISPPQPPRHPALCQEPWGQPRRTHAILAGAAATTLGELETWAWHEIAGSKLSGS
jgi:hypothetical protein